MPPFSIDEELLCTLVTSEAEVVCCARIKLTLYAPAQGKCEGINRPENMTLRSGLLRIGERSIGPKLPLDMSGASTGTEQRRSYADRMMDIRLCTACNCVGSLDYGAEIPRPIPPLAGSEYIRRH